ncbi:helix-turn-helix domain-containing protein [Zavarzinia sp.]|uniref:helix-turn-helix domain-containing protein n=1 Tax=Zavarzinia sp. TaxID=2027920 RepID=UPI003BB7F7BD|nr:helix-turn-helix transcriptional regulator [Zavarzinia sp.]
MIGTSTDTSIFAASIGRWLYGLRAVRGLTIDDLAARSGFCPARVREIEKGQARPAGIDELGELLKAIDPALLRRLVEFASNLGAASNSIDDACDLSHLASRLVAAFGGVTSTATRDAVADLVETIAGRTVRHYHA